MCAYALMIVSTVGSTVGVLFSHLLPNMVSLSVLSGFIPIVHTYDKDDVSI